jgi:signal transduction histidine kinase
MVIGFAGLAAAGIAAAWITMQTSQHTEWVNHTYDVELAIGRLQVAIEQTETTRRGYLMTGATEYRDAAAATAAQIDPMLDRLASLTRDNPRQVRRLADLKQRLADIRARQDETIKLAGTGKRDAAMTMFAGETNARRMRGIRDVLSAMADDERRLLAKRDAEQQASLYAFYIVLIIAGVLIVLVAATSIATVLRYTRDLTSARDRLQLLNTDLEGAVAVRTADLTRANEEIQRFAYIVSHDLRSPLVNVMGFTAELEAATTTLRELIDAVEKRAPGILTDEARTAAREDLPEAIGFIRTSTQKMDRLINAILRLSREGRRVLVPEPLSLADVAGTVRDSLQHLADDRDAEIVIEKPLPTLVGDRVAVEQVLSNLVENAIKYSSPDRPPRIVIRGRSDRDRRIIEVADNGRGIAESDHVRIFDLFRRSGVQDQSGEGIGLAHVRALVYRLGGTIDVASTLGAGTIFTVSLPAQLLDTGSTP